ncbi:MAG: DegT/DnrJ/EryC1/StrS family aminotransferase [Thermodesulfovibrionales bacterium]
MTIPMINLKKQFEELRPELMEAVSQVLQSTQYVLGPKVSEFEARVAEYCGVPEAVGVASGTDALHIALDAAGVGDGDEVITTPFTFFATVEAIIYTGATPVFVDIRAEDFNIDPGAIEEKITPRTKAILPVHMFGHPADMEAIAGIAERHGLKVIEDCAQAFGASIGGRKVGGFGEAGCFSFYPSKNLGGFGDGGLITFKDGALAMKARRLRNHGSAGSYVHEGVGFNSRLDELQAAVLLVKFKRIDRYNEARARKAAFYTGLLSGKVGCPTERPGCRHVYHQYTITSPARDEIQRRLKEAGIASTVYYPIPLHLQKALDFMGHREGDFPAAEKASKEVLSLPICPELEEADMERVAETVAGV